MEKFSPKAEAFLKERHFGKFASTRSDGSPHVTPIWYMLEKGRLFVNMTPARVKYKNITRDPRVCFLVDDGYPYVLVFGKARVAKERDGKKDIESLAIRYHGEEKGKRDARNYYMKQDRVTLEIVPDKILVAL